MVVTMNKSLDNLIHEISVFCKSMSFNPPFLVGSRAYDASYSEMPFARASTKDSDWDYIIPINLLQGIRQLCEKYSHQSVDTAGPNLTDSNYNNGFKFLLLDDKGNLMTVNIIPLIDLEYRAWKHATLALIEWAKTDQFIQLALTNRNARIGLLEQLRATYKTGLALGSIIQENKN